SSRRRHTRLQGDWSSDVCSSDLTLLAERLGLTLPEMAATQKYPVVVRTEIDYRRAAKLGDRLTIEGWLDQLERVRFWCAFRIVRSEERRVGKECRSGWWRGVWRG